MKTVFELHVEKWSDCKACKYHETRKRVVLSRGVVPCEVLFIGEGPGKSENVWGQPFVGPAGDLLNGIIEETLPGVDVAFTNLVGCLPTNDTGEKAVEPEKGCIESCSPRLLEFITEVATPKCIVCVGTVATRYITKLQLDLPLIHILHPAAILRAKTAHQGTMYRKCLIAITDGMSRLKHKTTI